MATIVRCNCGAEYRRTEAKFLVAHSAGGSYLENEPRFVCALTHEEFVSLRDCAKGFMHRTIPAEHKDRLIQLGYIQELSGGLRLTNAGRLRTATTSRSFRRQSTRRRNGRLLWKP